MATSNTQQQTGSKASPLKKSSQPSEQKNTDNKRVATVTPGNDNGDPGAPANRDSSNKGKGPAGEDL